LKQVGTFVHLSGLIDKQQHQLIAVIILYSHMTNSSIVSTLL
jgi:hypothetical protein